MGFWGFGVLGFWGLVIILQGIKFFLIITGENVSDKIDQYSSDTIKVKMYQMMLIN